jgi:hypothetical protein
MVNLLLKSISASYSNSDFTRLERGIRQLLDTCPVPVLEVSPSLPIQRLRNNYHGEIFTTEAEISFRQDSWNIRDFGRGNFPYSSKFYGSLYSKYIDEIRVVNVLETNKEFREKRMIKKRQIFTSGEWVTVQPLNVAIFPFDRNAILYNDEIKFKAAAFAGLLSKFTPEQEAVYREVLRFISHFYSLKDICSHSDYAISAYVSELLISKYGLDGILYPSVRAQFRTYNLVLEPGAVLSKLRLERAAMFELILNRRNAVIDNVAFADISLDFRLAWNYTERISERQLNHLV